MGIVLIIIIFGIFIIFRIVFFWNFIIVAPEPPQRYTTIIFAPEPPQRYTTISVASQTAAEVHNGRSL